MHRIAGICAAVFTTALAAQPGLVASEIRYDQLLDVNSANGSTTPLGKLGHARVSGLAWDPNNDILYGVSSYPNDLLTIDPATGRTTIVGSFGSGFISMHGVAYHHENGKLYGVSAGTNSLYSIDAKTGAGTVIGKHGLAFVGGMAHDFIRDRMYVSDVAKNSLHVIDLKTGKATRVGYFGMGKFLGTALAFDPVFGLFAMDNLAASNAPNVLYKIDPNTARATRIGAAPVGNILGLEFVDGACLPARARSYGTGFPGTNRTPSLTATPPLIGKMMTLRLSNSSNTATAGVLVLHGRRAAQPAFWGGTLHVTVSGAILWGVPVPANGATLPITLPATAACGAAVFAQGVLIDRGARVGLSNTAGLELRMGKR